MLEVTGVTERKAENLIDEYGNLYTISWAATHDQEYLQNEFQINPDFLHCQMMEAGVWQRYWENKTELAIPDRRSDWFDQANDEDIQTRWSDYTGDR